MSETKATKRRLPRTGILLLLGVVVLIAGSVLVSLSPYYPEQQAIAEIESLGGKTESEVMLPAWITDAVDDAYLNYFQRVKRVDLSSTQVSDSGLKRKCPNNC